MSKITSWDADSEKLITKKRSVAQLVGAVEYTDCFSAEE